MNLQERLVRYEDLIPCKNAFIDTRSPGSDQKENFTIIGPGVSENPEQHIHISIAHGFNIGGARQPNGCLNSQHSHLTEEVFIVHSGTWAFRAGVSGQDAEVILQEGDIISLPTDIFRGFENVGNGSGYLFAILGQDDPGKVTWAPQVFDLAEEHGLVLLENGALVDTTIGQTVPEDVAVMPRTTQKQIDQHRKVSNADMQQLVVRKNNFVWSNHSALAAFQGVKEAPLVGAASEPEGLHASRLHWPHEFVVRVIEMQVHAIIPPHVRFEEEVLFVLEGELTIDVDDQTLSMKRGDTFTTPINATRTFYNNGEVPVVFYVTRRGNQPRAPQFL